MFKAKDIQRIKSGFVKLRVRGERTRAQDDKNLERKSSPPCESQKKWRSRSRKFGGGHTRTFSTIPFANLRGNVRFPLCQCPPCPELCSYYVPSLFFANGRVANFSEKSKSVPEGGADFSSTNFPKPWQGLHVILLKKTGGEFFSSFETCRKTLPARNFRQPQPSQVF